MMGYQKLFLPVIEAKLEHAIKKSGGVREFIRCRIRHQDGQTFVSSTGAQGSGVLRSMSLAQGLLVTREEETSLAEGSLVRVILLHHRDLIQPEMGF